MDSSSGSASSPAFDSPTRKIQAPESFKPRGIPVPRASTAGATTSADDFPANAATGDDAVVLLDVEGMMCGGCVSRVRNQLLQDPRVDSAAVNILTETAAVKLGPRAGLELAKLLTGSGFPTRLQGSDAQDEFAGRKLRELSEKKKLSVKKSTQSTRKLPGSLRSKASLQKRNSSSG